MYHLAKKINTIASMCTSYTYISPYTTGKNHVEKSDAKNRNNHKSIIGFS